MDRTSILGAVGAISLLLASCGGANSSDESMLFGKVPSIVANYQVKNDELKEQFKSCSSESEGKKIFEEAEALEKETFAKVEEAANAWSGATLDLTSDEMFAVKTPVTAAFDGFFSKSSFKVRYNLAGEIVTAKDCIWEPVTDKEKMVVKSILGYGLEKYHQAIVNIVGLDAEGNEITSDKIGIIPLAIIDGKVGIAANTPVKFEPLVMSSKLAPEYPLVKSLALRFEDNIK